MLGFFRFFRWSAKRLTSPKRLNTRRITVVESERFSDIRLAPQVAQVMGWKLHSDSADEKETEVVISWTAHASNRNRVVSKADGLTVRVDDVCDLERDPDISHCLRRIMIELREATERQN